MKYTLNNYLLINLGEAALSYARVTCIEFVSSSLRLIVASPAATWPYPPSSVESDQPVNINRIKSRHSQPVMADAICPGIVSNPDIVGIGVSPAL